MRIDRTSDPVKYYDVNGKEIHEDNIVLMKGTLRRVYRTENNELGTDATNPVWVRVGRAGACEFGIYPFDEADEVKIIASR